MKTAKTQYNDLPETIQVPKELVHKKAEVIFIIDEKDAKKRMIMLKDFSGTIPDLPERGSQGKYEKREEL